MLQRCIELWHGGNVPEAECYYVQGCTAHSQQAVCTISVAGTVLILHRI